MCGGGGGDVVVVCWVFPDNNTTPTKVVLFCFVLLVELCQYIQMWNIHKLDIFCYLP